MNPQDQWLHQKEKVLAWVRLGFSIAGIVVVLLNPERGARFPLLSQTSLISFFLYSLLVSVVVSRAEAARGRLNLSWLAPVTTCLDLMWVTVIVLSTGSPTPFFAYYFFPVLTASSRYGIRGGMLAAVIGLFLYGLIRFHPAAQDAVALDIFIIRSIYLLFLAYIFGLLSEFEQKQNRKLAALYKTAAAAAAKEERSRIARELHDQLLQTLATLCLRLEACARNLSEGPEETGRELRSMQEMTRHSIAEIRDFLSGKEISVLAPGTLIESLKGDLSFLRDGLGVHVILDNEPEELNLPAEAERELYYVIREGVMNIAKHAHASNAAVLLRVAGRQVRGAVEDDGVGFDAEHRAPNGTLGLRSMEERIRKLGGSFDVQAGVGQGTRLSFTIPLPV
ncbi:MAG TPA: sensor histidine kinase [Candidatus Binatia bacterium]|jgi:signal transduction histidine kinase